MAKKAVVEGELKIREGHNINIEFYEETFLLDDSVASLEQARAIIKKGLLNERLRKRDNFKGIRTCQVVSFTKTDEVAEAGDLDKLLIIATELNCIPENLVNYKRPDHKIKALEKAIENAKKRKEKIEKDNVTDEGYVD